MNLRDALRTETRGAHDALDASMSALDLSDRGDLATFLRVSASGFAGIGGAGPASGALREMRLAIGRDLAALGLAVPMPEPSAAAHPLAGAYVVLGSRLGLAALSRRHPEAPARAYLGLAGRGAEWRSLCGVLAGIEADSVEGRAVTRAAIAHFEAFGRAAARHVEGERARVA